jgi:hypothetical protein
MLITLTMTATPQARATDLGYGYNAAGRMIQSNSTAQAGMKRSAIPAQSD